MGERRHLAETIKTRLRASAFLGLALHYQKRYSEAEGPFQQAADSQQRLFGRDHEVTLESKHLLGLALYFQEKYIKAERLLRQVVDRREKTLSIRHNDTLESKCWLGLVLYKQKKYSEAKGPLQEAVNWQERTLGRDHQVTLKSKQRLGLALYKQKKVSEAEELLQQVADKEERIYSKDHPEVQATARLLEELKLNFSPPLSIAPTNNTVSQTSDGQLERFFQMGQGSRKPYTNSKISEISSLLGLSNPRWSKVPQRYIILRTISHLNLLDDIVDVGFSNFWFPITERGLPECLSPAICTALYKAQHLILTKSIDLEKGEKGQHYYFNQGDPLPWELKGVIGNSGFGQADKVLSIISHKEYTRKRVPRSITFSSPRKEHMKQFITKIQLLKRLKHHHIVEFVGSYTDTRYIGLIMSPVAEMDLAAYLTRCTISCHPELRTFFSYLATALDFLHGQKVRHKDIKPGNILVDRGNILFTDFGLSLDFTDVSGSTTTSIVRETTPRYYSPEVAQYEPQNIKSDIWSLGIVFMEMITVLKGKTIQDMDEFFEQHGSQQAFIRTNMAALSDFVVKLERSGEPSDNRVLSWIQQMLCAEAQLRPTASSLVSSIVESVGFCGICCASPEEGFSDWADE